MAIIRESYTQGTNSSTANSSVVVTGVATGDSILISARWDNAVTESLTCSGETVTALGSIESVPPGFAANCRHRWWVINNVSGSGSLTINNTLSGSPNTNNCLVAWRLSGTLVSGIAGTPVTGSGTSTSPSVTVTTGAANSAIFAAFISQAGDTYTSPSGYTNEVANNLHYYDGYDYNLDVGAAGAKTPTWTIPWNASYFISAVEIKAAGGGGGGGVPKTTKLALLGVG